MNRRELLAAGAATLLPVPAAAVSATPPERKRTAWPTRQELTAFAEERARREEACRDIFKHVPIVATDDTKLRWDSFQPPTGLTGGGVTGGLAVRDRLFVFACEADPSPYGGCMVLSDDELIGVRRGDLCGHEVVYEKAQLLVLQRFDRIEATCWERLTGRPGVARRPWNRAGSDPLGDLNPHGRPAPLDRPHAPHVRYDRHGVAYANSTVTDAFLRRYGRVVSRGPRYNERYQEALDGLTRSAGTARLVRHDAGYIDAAGAFRPFVPDGVAVLFGWHLTGLVPVGEYRMTVNADRPDLKGGSYTRCAVVYPEGRPAVRDTHNGGVVVWWDDAVATLQVLERPDYPSSWPAENGWSD